MSKAKAITNQITNDDYLRRQIFRVLLGSLIALSLGYMYIIGSITFNTLARKSLEKNSQTVGSQVGQLELKYMALSSSIDTTYAMNHGFVNAPNSLFANRDSTVRVAMR